MKKTTYIILVLLIFTSCGNGELFDSTKSISYFNNNGKIIYCTDGNWIAFGKTKVDCDLSTFQVLSNHIAKDKNKIFYSGVQQNHVDYESFFIDKNIPKDENYPYKNGIDKLIPIKGVEPNSFEYLEIDTLNKTWSKDINNYYLNYKKLNVDRETFKFINKRFSMDKDSLYADLNSWKFISIKPISSGIEVINDEYIREDSILYYVSSFKKVELLENKFVSFDDIRIVDKDVIIVNDKVIYYGKLFKYNNVDSESFELYFPNVISHYSKDRQNVYYQQEIIQNADPLTFEPLRLSFGKDKSKVFYKTEFLDGVDPKTFIYVGKFGVAFKDANGNEFDWQGNKL